MQEQKYNSRLDIKWFAKLSDGSKVIESNDIAWSDVENRVVELSLVSGHQTLISLPSGMKKYIQGKTGSCGLMGGEISIESRWIGFETSDGAQIKVRRTESNGIINVEV